MRLCRSSMSAGRIVGIGQHDAAGAFGDLRLQNIELQMEPGLLAHGHWHVDRADLQHVVDVLGEAGLDVEHLVTHVGPDADADAQIQAHRGAGHHQQLGVGVDFELVEGRQLAHQCLTQLGLGVAVGQRIVRASLIQRPFGRLDDMRRQARVREEQVGSGKQDLAVRVHAVIWGEIGRGDMPPGRVDIEHGCFLPYLLDFAGLAGCARLAGSRAHGVLAADPWRHQ